MYNIDSLRLHYLDKSQVFGELICPSFRSGGHEELSFIVLNTINN